VFTQPNLEVALQVGLWTSGSVTVASKLILSNVDNRNLDLGYEILPYEKLPYGKLHFYGVIVNNSPRVTLLLFGGDYSQDGEKLVIHGISVTVKRHLLDWLIERKRNNQEARGAELPQKFWVGAKPSEDGKEKPRLLIAEEELSLEEMISELAAETPKEQLAVKAVALRGQRRKL
jgi:hypothetical protein